MITQCVFCGDERLRVRFPGYYHQVAQDYGPFDLAECEGCGSLVTLNPPSTEALADFYANFAALRVEHRVWAEKNDAMQAQYDDFARVVARAYGEHAPASWLDIGCGNGEAANVFAAKWSGRRGVGVDFGARPERLNAAIDYAQRDLNAANWTDGVPPKSDLVYSIAVWEHVSAPVQFVQSALKLTAAHGACVLICPNARSAARQLLGTAWPYFLPGEHLHMPSPKGAIAAVHQAAQAEGLAAGDYTVSARPTPIAYDMRYAFVSLKLGAVASLIPKGMSVPLPVGGLTTTIRLS